MGIKSAPMRTHSVGVLKLHKTVKVFYTAAWWRVLASNTSNVERTAYSDDLISRGMSHAIPWTVMEAVTSPTAQRIHAIADVLANQMHETFLHLIATNKKNAAQAYAKAMTASGVAAQNQYEAMTAEVNRHNANTVEAATRAAVFLSDTIFVSECALAVGGCILSFGLAPAFLAGGAEAAMLLSSGYALAGQVVKSAQGGEVSTAVDPDFDIDQGASVAGYGGGKLLDRKVEAREAAILKSTKTYKTANSRILFLSKQLGQKMKAGSRARLVKNIAEARNERALAHTEMEALERSKSMLKFGSTRALPIIQAGLDVFFACKAQQSRLDDMHVDWLGHDR